MATIGAKGGRKLRQKGSHVRVVCACGCYFSTVPAGRNDMKIGTLKNIQRSLAACANFGEGWLGI
jgi:predicted RNA binding protein YcfA (HicA-like mRNA interferase family)